jgi:hypothetical protein
LLQEIDKKYQELAIESAENEITFRNIDVSQFQEVIAVVNIENKKKPY